MTPAVRLLAAGAAAGITLTLGLAMTAVIVLVEQWERVHRG